ncbi:MAG: hypothetical protein J6M39_02820 [Lachnospiraceae bacterium]|nr:hypothetical protein [Lachnospiraceae bacterium]
MEVKTKKRNIYIDIMKGLLITLVVIGHLPYFEYDSRTLTLIYSFHMHAFLIIGGILSHINENTKISTIIHKRVMGTLLPYFVFYLITFIIVPTTTEQKINAIPVVLKGIGIPPDHALNLPLWFLTFYFVTMTGFEIIQCISYKIITSKIKTQNKNLSIDNSSNSINLRTLSVTFLTFVFITIIMFISFYYARIYKLKRLPYNIEIAGFCLGFVFLGNVLGKTIPRIYSLVSNILFDKKNNNTSILNSGTKEHTNTLLLRIIVIVISTFAVILIAKTWYEYSMWNGRIDLNARDYKNAFYMYVDAILGFILFAIFSYIIYIVSVYVNEKIMSLLNKNVNSTKNNVLSQKMFRVLLFLVNAPNKLFSYLGKNSLYILAYHVPSVYFSNRFIIPYLPSFIRETLSHNSIISILILTTLGISISLFLSLINQSIDIIRKNVLKK